MDILLSNIGQLVTPIESPLDRDHGRYDLQITQDTQLYIRNGRILSPVPRHTPSTCQTIDAAGGVILPGLMDPFWVMPTVPAWMGDRSEMRGTDLLSWSSRVFGRALSCGVTSIEVKCPHKTALEGFAVLGHLRQHAQPHIVGTLMASLAEDGIRRDDLVSTLISEAIPLARQRGLATFFDVGWDDHDGALTAARTVLRAAIGAGVRPKLHVDSQQQMAEAQALALSLEVAAVGGVAQLAPEMARTLAENDILPVYLPAIQDQASSGGIDVQSLLDFGLPLAIGSGNGLPGCAAKSMWAVLAMAMERMNLSLAEALVACTANNAIAMDLEHDLGSLEDGKCADLILLDLMDYREIEATVGVPPISMVMMHGEVVFSG